MKRIIFNVATGERYLARQNRLLTNPFVRDEETIICRDTLPRGCPPHAEVPYAFKSYGLKAIWDELGDELTLLWLDSSIVPVKNLGPLWDLIEREGYWFSANLPYAQSGVPPWTCGPLTSDAALAPLGITREEAFLIPHVIATAFGLSLSHAIGRQFLLEWYRLACEKTAFQGEWENRNGVLSSDARVVSHRHDQTAASVIAWRLGMRLTTPPCWIVDGIPSTEDTILEIRR